MEKMLRTILNKKIHPQSSNNTAKKYLENHKIIDEARSSVTPTNGTRLILNGKSLLESHLKILNLLP
ncbi:unnamed protein product [Brassica oleracea]|uniref:Uncharacterized protein n=1 Tax=Brassica oleracea TaxID=3712 RepID=A0A3P6EZ88_BRAOL|nr:unnamed protein product [Brassica oleracea]